jgi:hypothetical protein
MTANQASPARAGLPAAQAATARPHDPADHPAICCRPTDLPLDHAASRCRVWARSGRDAGLVSPAEGEVPPVAPGGC